MLIPAIKVDITVQSNGKTVPFAFGCEWLIQIGNPNIITEVFHISIVTFNFLKIKSKFSLIFWGK